jgi:hypothetical protein
MTARRYTRARRERDVWVARGYVGNTCVAIVTSTVSAEDAERVAAERAGVEWAAEPVTVKGRVE